MGRAALNIGLKKRANISLYPLQRVRDCHMDCDPIRCATLWGCRICRKGAQESFHIKPTSYSESEASTPLRQRVCRKSIFKKSFIGEPSLAGSVPWILFQVA